MLDGLQQLLEDLLLYMAKSYRPLSSIEDIWLRRMCLRIDPHIVFPSRRQLSEEILPAMVEKTMERYVIPNLESCVSAMPPLICRC